MSYVRKTQAVGSSDSVDQLIRALYRTVGNKVFMRDIEELFHARLGDVSGQDAESLRMLARALGNTQDDHDHDRKKPWMRGF